MRRRWRTEVPTIRVDDDVYAWLKSLATPFEDTPNSVLRRVAELDKQPDSASTDKAAVEVNHNEKGGNKMSLHAPPTRYSGKELARQWNVPVKHALYHKDGEWYQRLRYFPGALFDPNGYVVFQTEKEYDESPYLQHGIELHVPNGIASMPNYHRIHEGKP